MLWEKKKTELMVNECVWFAIEMRTSMNYLWENLGYCFKYVYVPLFSFHILLYALSLLAGPRHVYHVNIRERN